MAPAPLVLDACALLHAKQLHPEQGALQGLEILERLAARHGARYLTSTGVNIEMTSMSLSETLYRPKDWHGSATKTLSARPRLDEILEELERRCLDEG